MERLKEQPGIGTVINLIETWPRITAWIVLSLGCIILLVYEARDVGLTTGNWIALIVATIGVSGLCIWIVSWEDEEDENLSTETPAPERSKSPEAAEIVPADDGDSEGSDS